MADTLLTHKLLLFWRGRADWHLGPHTREGRGDVVPVRLMVKRLANRFRR